MNLTRQKFLSREEHDELQVTLTKYMNSDFRNTTFIWMLLHTGARVSEVLDIRPKDLTLEDNIVYIRGLKNCRDRELPLTPFLYNRMKVLSSKLGPDDKVFGFGYSNALVIWHHWRPGKKKLHSLRHFRAQEVYLKTRDIRLVQTMLGHTSIETTMIYLDYVYSANELRRAML